MKGYFLRAVDGNDGGLVSAVIEEADVDALENLSADLLHRLAAAVRDGDVHVDSLSVMIQLHQYHSSSSSSSPIINSIWLLSPIIIKRYWLWSPIIDIYWLLSPITNISRLLSPIINKIWLLSPIIIKRYWLLSPGPGFICIYRIYRPW